MHVYSHNRKMEEERISVPQRHKWSNLIDVSFNMPLKKLDIINIKLTLSGTFIDVYILNVGSNLENT